MHRLYIYRNVLLIFLQNYYYCLFHSGMSKDANILIDGFEGLDNMPDIEIRDEWNALFGESEKSS